MATTTTNNGWDIPTSTDYVKDGATAIATLGQDIDTSIGTGLLAWQSYAPSLSGGWANGNGTWEAAYVQIGKTVHYRGYFTLGSTTSKGSVIAVSVPVNIKTGSTAYPLTVAYLDAGGTRYIGNIKTNSSTTIVIQAINTAGTYASATSVTSAVPGTWATGDAFSFNITYEAA